MISPILTYNNEVWGAFVKPDFKSWAEIALQLRKPIYNSTDLQVHNKASNIACRAELVNSPRSVI